MPLITKAVIFTAIDNAAIETLKDHLKVQLDKPNGPQVCNIRCNELRKTLVVQVANEAERVKLEQLTQGSSVLQASRPKGINPSVTLYNVSKETTNDTVVKCIVEKNDLNNANISDIKVVRTFTNKSGETDRVVSMPHAVHSQLMARSNKRIYLQYTMVYYKSRVTGIRCYKCFGLGHTDVGGSCRNRMSCGRCGAEGHTMKGCDKPLKCVNCVRGGRKGDSVGHMATDSKCPCLQRHLATIKLRISGNY